jgi:hypothetical protein
MSFENLRIYPVQCDWPAGIVDVPVAPEALPLSVFPNPAWDRMTIRFTTPARGPVLANVYDVGGRLVRTLCDRVVSGGVHDLFWDGRDQAAHEIAAGVYMVRVSTGAGARTERVLVVR